MPCDRKLRRGQSLQDRAKELKAAAERVSAALAAGKVKAKVGPQGAIAFDGITDADRDGATDSCIYRRLMVSGSALARAAIARAEQMAGRTVDRQVIGQGAHGHVDAAGNVTWHEHR